MKKTKKWKKNREETLKTWIRILVVLHVNCHGYSDEKKHKKEAQLKKDLDTPVIKKCLKKVLFIKKTKKGSPSIKKKCKG